LCVYVCVCVCMCVCVCFIVLTNLGGNIKPYAVTSVPVLILTENVTF